MVPKIKLRISHHSPTRSEKLYGILLAAGTALAVGAMLFHLNLGLSGPTQGWNAITMLLVGRFVASLESRAVTGLLVIVSLGLAGYLFLLMRGSSPEIGWGILLFWLGYGLGQHIARGRFPGSESRT